MSYSANQLRRREAVMYALMGACACLTILAFTGGSTGCEVDEREPVESIEVIEAKPIPSQVEETPETAREMHHARLVREAAEARALVADQMECVVKVIGDMHLGEHWDRDPDELREFADASWAAGRAHDVDPMLLMAVAYRESRLRFLTGDDGEACGPWQHSVRYLPEVVSGEVSEAYACEELMVDIDLAANTAADRLARYGGEAIQRHVCHYQQGGTCRAADLRGEPDTYSGRVLAVHTALVDQCGEVAL